MTRPDANGHTQAHTHSRRPNGSALSTALPNFWRTLLYAFVLVALNFECGEHERGRVYALSFLRALAKVFQHLETLKFCQDVVVLP